MKNKRIEIRIKETEKKLIQMLAKENNQTITDFIMQSIYKSLKSVKNEKQN